MPTQSLTLDRFVFPLRLPGNRANFRVVFDVKYWEGSGDKATLKSTNAIKPGIDTFWECDPSREGKANFRRLKEEDQFHPEVNVVGLDKWDRTVITVSTTGFHSVRAKIFDVDREGSWDFVRDFAGSLVDGILTAGKEVAGAAVPSIASDAVGGAVDELSSYLVKKMAGGSDKVLFQGSARLVEGTVTIEGAGTEGVFHLRLTVSTEAP